MKNPDRVPVYMLPLFVTSFGLGLGFGSACSGKPFEMVAETPIGIIRVHVTPANTNISPFVKDMQDVINESIQLA
jgi:hypothetical protein